MNCVFYFDEIIIIFIAIGISNNKEPKALAKKVVALFSGVSRYQQSTGKDGSSATLPQDLLSMVTYIAQLLKTLIRFAITGALRLVIEIIDCKVDFIGTYLLRTICYRGFS